MKEPTLCVLKYNTPYITILFLMISYGVYSQTPITSTVANIGSILVKNIDSKNEIKLIYNPAFIYSQRIQASSDDGLEVVGGKGGPTMKLTDADVKFAKAGNGDSAGLRFTGLNIPEYATITSAFMYWDNGEASKAKSGSVQIYAEDSGTPLTFSVTYPDISNRTKTTNSVQYDISWAGGETNQQTPDLVTVVQEVVDNNSGLTDIVFILVENASSNDELKIISFDDVPAQAAQLEVNYEEVPLSDNNKETYLSVNAYPNPTTDKIILNFGTTIREFTITLLNTRGQIVKEMGFINKKRAQLNLSDLSSGLYFAKIKTDKKTGLIKIMKQ